jgi:hypothetical protein
MAVSELARNARIYPIASYEARAVPESVFSDFKGLRQHVKHYGFSPNFKGLSYKR